MTDIQKREVLLSILAPLNRTGGEYAAILELFPGTF